MSESCYHVPHIGPRPAQTAAKGYHTPMRLLLVISSLLVMATLAGCASVTLVDSRKGGYAPTGAYRNVLVVGITKDRQTRQVFEEVIASELRSKGVAATPSYTVTGVEQQISRDLIVNAVKSVGTDAVITTRLVDLKKKTHTDVGYTMTSRGFDSYVDWYGSGTVSYATFDMSPVEVTTSTTYALQTNLFDTATQNLVWSGISNAVDPKGIITASREYSGVVITVLSKEGYLP